MTKKEIIRIFVDLDERGVDTDDQKELHAHLQQKVFVLKEKLTAAEEHDLMALWNCAW